MAVADQAAPRRPQLAARLAWPACALTMALLAGALLIPANSPVGMTGVAPLAMWAAASAVVGAVVARRPQNPIGWLLSVSGLLVSFGLLAGQYAYYTLVTRPGSLPGGQAMLWLAGWPFDAGVFLVLFLLLFPPAGSRPLDGDVSPCSPVPRSWPSPCRRWAATPPTRCRSCSG
jgi:hypothetical protein